MKKIFVFGNGDLEMDSLPLRILPRLEEKFSEVKFEVKDPNEDWNVPEELIMIDTVVGIKDVTVFEDLEKFSGAPRVSMHDFDALTNLRLLQKIGKIKKVKVIGVPPEMGEEEVVDKIIKIIKENAVL
jgi:hypothetical protein